MSSNADALARIGSDFIVGIVRVAIGGVCYGVYLILIASSTTILFRRGWRHVGAMVLLVITLILFLGSTMFFIIDLWELVVRFKTVFIENQGQPIDDKSTWSSKTKLLKFMWTGRMLFVFMLILGDAIVLWRTWVIYTSNRLPLVAPCLAFLGSVITAFYELGCAAAFHWMSPDSSASTGIEACGKVAFACVSLSYATNILCTSLIMYRAWHYRQTMRKFFNTVGRETQVEKLLVLLTESGAVYLVIYTIQAIQIYKGSYSPPTTMALGVVKAVVQQAVGMYPTAIVVLVQLQKTLWDTSERSRVQSAIEFAPCGPSGLGGRKSHTPTVQNQYPVSGQHIRRATIDVRRVSSSTSFIGLAK